MRPAPRLHHLALGARDVGALAAFYRDRIGLPETARHHHPDGRLRSVWLALGDAVLMVEEAPAGGNSPPGDTGLFLFAFEMEPAARAAVEAVLEAESQTEHTRYYRDPEGNRFAISDYPLPG